MERRKFVGNNDFWDILSNALVLLRNDCHYNLNFWIMKTLPTSRAFFDLNTRVTIDSQVKFDDHITALCQIANRKIRVFSRVANFLNYEKGKILYNTFVMSNLAIAL